MSVSQMENNNTMINTFRIRISSFMLGNNSSIQPFYDLLAQNSEDLRNIIVVDNNEKTNYPVTPYQEHFTSDTSDAINGIFVIDTTWTNMHSQNVVMHDNLISVYANSPVSNAAVKMDIQVG